MKLLIILLSLTISNILAHSGEKHYGDYSSNAKTMIDNNEKYHKNSNIIRKMHPAFMQHKRDKTLLQGIRSEEFSLKSCVNCHSDETGKKRIDDDGQFCADCHKKVGTSIDCFSCHRATIKESN